MKKLALLVLISLMTLNSFGLTQEEREKIYEAIVAKAKEPDLLSPKDIFGNKRIKQPLPELISKDISEARKASKYLCSLPPAMLVPAFYELRMEGKLNSAVDYYAIVRISDSNKYDKSSYKYILNNEPIVQKKRKLNEIDSDYLLRCGQTYLEGSLVKMVDPKA